MIFNYNCELKEINMSGSGIILYTKKYGKIKYLGLEVEQYIAKKHQGKWDLPKGTQELNENSLACAIRETHEETGILVFPEDVSKESLVIGRLQMYFAETNQDPIINPNPASGIIEHIGYSWLEEQDLYNGCFIWLKPFVKWISRKQL